MNSALFLCVFLLFWSWSSSQGFRCTRKNEMLRCDECPPERSCTNRDIAFKCFVQPHCRQSCVCKKGFIRNHVNECVSDKICDSCTGPNEIWDCGSACDNECASLQQQNRTNCPIQNIVCNPKCYCKDGYARDANGVCIPIDKCWQTPSTPDCSNAGWWWFFRGGVFYVAYPDCSTAATSRRAAGVPKKNLKVAHHH